MVSPQTATVLIGDDKKEPVKFRLVARSEMGLGRRAGKKPGFAQALSLIHI